MLLPSRQAGERPVSPKSPKGAQARVPGWDGPVAFVTRGAPRRAAPATERPCSADIIIARYRILYFNRLDAGDGRRHSLPRKAVVSRLTASKPSALPGAEAGDLAA